METSPTKSPVFLVALTAIVSIIVTSAFWLAGTVLAYHFFLGDGSSGSNYGQPNLAVSVDAPVVVASGEKFELALSVTNPTDHALSLDSIDIYDTLLDGFTLVQIDPKPNDTDPTLGFLSLYYAEPLDPGKSFHVSLTLEAAKAGVWTGDVDFCDPALDYVTSAVTIRVRD